MMKKMIVWGQYFCLLLLGISFQSCAEETEGSSLIEESTLEISSEEVAFRLKNETVQAWQSELEDNLPVSEVLLPGTHDAGAYVRGGALIETQALSFQEQLEIGVRAFDIRLRATAENKLEIYHGISAQALYFEENILNESLAFLTENPTEFLIFSLKKEGSDLRDSQGYEVLLKQVLEESEYTSIFYPHFAKNLKVGDLRSRILVLHRSNCPTSIGGFLQNWRDNNSFEANIATVVPAKNARLFVEDNYKVSTLFHIDEKWNVIADNLELSATNAEDWFITFTSGSSAFAYPVSVAKRINPKLQTFLQIENDYKGIVFVDFIDKEITETIVQVNF